MERLDRDEQEAHMSHTPRLTSAQIAASLGDLQSLFVDAEPATQHRIAAALFEQVEVLGPNEVWLYPTVEAEARGWADAMAGEFKVESRYGRGERTRAFTIPIWERWRARRVSGSSKCSRPDARSKLPNVGRATATPSRSAWLRPERPFPDKVSARRVTPLKSGCTRAASVSR
jgi:hypothetical protein